MAEGRQHRRQWRFYETKAGNKPVKAFLDDLPATEAAEIVATMKHVAEKGLEAARHLHGDIWEVRVDGENRIYRVLFSAEGRFRHVLLALEGFTKKTQKTPPRTIQRAEKRLSEWRTRGKARKKGQG
ncbi:MAG: type II toxin-antitoxin system RelE/ParE family toxin [Myxococcota bacterium]